MKVLVLGAGILGTATAWYLRQAGHNVTVVDRQPGAALETSFANGGQISVSHAEPWANPAAPRKILHWLGRDDAPLLFRPRADWHQWHWALAFLRECQPSRTHQNTAQLIGLGMYSRRSLRELRQELAIEYARLERGILHFFTDAAEFEAAQASMAMARDRGMRIEFLSPDQIVRLEPALEHARALLAGGVYAPDDESGDAHRFTRTLADHCAARGVEFRYNTTVTALLADAGRITGVRVREHGHEREPELTLKADAYVVALGSWSAPLLRKVGVRTLIYPVKGYSATLPLRDPAAVCSISLTDHAMKIVFSRLGDELRVAGTAELTGYDLTLDPVRCAALVRRASQLFPGALDVEAARYWCGLRPATPSNIPYIGRSKLDNLWLNTGHGTLGWTFGAGSGRALATLMSGNTPALDFAFCGQ